MDENLQQPAQPVQKTAQPSGPEENSGPPALRWYVRLSEALLVILLSGWSLLHLLGTVDLLNTLIGQLKAWYGLRGKYVFTIDFEQFVFIGFLVAFLLALAGIGRRKRWGVQIATFGFAGQLALLLWLLLSSSSFFGALPFAVLSGIGVGLSILVWNFYRPYTARRTWSRLLILFVSFVWLSLWFGGPFIVSLIDRTQSISETSSPFEPGCISATFDSATTRADVIQILEGLGLTVPPDVTEHPQWRGFLIPTFKIETYDPENVTSELQADPRVGSIDEQFPDSSDRHVLTISFKDYIPLDEASHFLTVEKGYELLFPGDKYSVLRVDVPEGEEDRYTQELAPHPLVLWAGQCYKPPSAAMPL